MRNATKNCDVLTFKNDGQKPLQKKHTNAVPDEKRLCLVDI